MFRFAHLTDPHVGPLPRPALRHLLGKRITGYVNWRRGRREAHDMDLLAALVRDLREQAPDHIVCTGDVCNLGLASEWPSSRLFLDGLGSHDTVSFVPGNHDAYVPGSLEGLLEAVDPFAVGDEPGLTRFPFVRRRGPVAFIGLSSAIPTAPFVASGRLGRTQTKHAEACLAALAEEPLLRVVLIHHPPHVGGAPTGRNLVDAHRFEAMIARVGADLIIHGHNHVGSVSFLEGPHGPVPVVGAPSASDRGGALTHPAGYHLFRVHDEEGRFRISAELRGLDAEGVFGSQGAIDISGNTAHRRVAGHVRG
ncbi:metallophosphoesterase [Enterovirga sp.]|uniref:metallophosphoesterase family protein n=1 Tax=Enterovirga sp. TaxID=2026350 RepID=UPI002612A532|nr:metallophosphoesterase [Enterovirga sp.]MDB5590438.1 metallophosphoesterase [Enterovirga sp.]